jgi:hypothetical protein
MTAIDLNRQPQEEWHSSVMTRMIVSAANGAALA